MTGTRRLRISHAFRGEVTTLEERRQIWLEALHEDVIWEGPTFERPVCVIGREAMGRFLDLLLSLVPRFTVTAVATYPTSDLETVIVESHGGGPTVNGSVYTQRYLSLITMRLDRTFRMREYCNPFQTYQAFGKDRWERALDEIMAESNKPWPASQAADPISLPSVAGPAVRPVR